MRARIPFLVFISIVALGLRAATLTWDANAATAGAQDGGGTWDATGTNWWSGAVNVAWNSGTPDAAIFGAGATAGTINVGAPVSVGNLSFASVASGSYLVQSGTITLVGTPAIDTAASGGTIASALAGSGFSKSGTGRLTLLGNSSFTGDVAIAQGVLQVGSIATNQYLNALGANLPGRTATLSSGTTLDLRGRDMTSTGMAFVLNGATITNNGFNRLGAITLNAGRIAAGQGNASSSFQNYALHGDVSVTGSGLSTIAGSTSAFPGIHLDKVGGVIVDVADTVAGAAPDLDVSAVLVNISNNGGNGALTKSGAGTLVLSGQNQARGAATVGAGTVILTNGSWSGMLVLSNGTTAVALGGPGLMGAYFNTAPPNPHPAWNTYTNFFAYLAALNPNILAGSVAAGTNFDFGGTGAAFPPSYNASAVNFQVRWVGQLVITNTGLYYFDTASDDGSVLFIDGQFVVNNNFSQGVTARSGAAYLTAGLHEITIGFYQGTGGYGMYADVLNGSTRLQNGALISGPGVGGLSGEAGSTLVVSNGLLSIAQAAAGTFAGSIGGNGGLYKFGTAPLTLSGGLSYTGDTVVAGGTLALTAAAGLSNSPNITLRGGATLDLTAIPGYAVRSGQTLAGQGIVSGSLVIVSGASVLPGERRNAGNLSVTGNLDLQAGSDLVMDFSGGTTNDLLSVAGALTMGGRLVVAGIGATPIGAGPFRVANVGSQAGAFSSVESIGLRATFGVDYLTPGQINLYVTNSAANLRWTGTSGGVWLNGNTQWVNTASSLPDIFVTGDAVLFDDTPGAQPNVLVGEPVGPATVTVSNSALAYTFSGSRLYGAMSLAKQGTNVLVLSQASANEFTGQVTVANGYLRMGSVGALGSNAGVTVGSGGQVQLNGIAQAAYNYAWTIAGAGPDGRGAIMNTNANIATASTLKWLTLSSNATIGIYGTQTNDNGRTDVGYLGGVQGNGFTLTKVGNNVLDLRGSATNLQFVAAEGFTYGENVNDAFGTNAEVLAGAFIGGYGGRTFSMPVTLRGGALSSRSGGGGCFWTGPVAVPTNSFITTGPGLWGMGNENISIHGPISGPGGITVYGGATTIYRGTNTYTGLTTVRNSGGTLLLATSNSYAIVGNVQLGHLADGGGSATLQMEAGNQFGPGVSLSYGGSIGDWTYLKLMGTTQYLASLVTDDNGGPHIENVEAETNIVSDGVLVLTGPGDSYYSGTYLRDRNAGTSPGRVQIIQAGAGTLTLATGNSPSPMFTGGIIVSNGMLNLKTRQAAGLGPITLAGGGLALDGYGLQEGSIGSTSIAITNANPNNTAVKLSTRRANSGTDFGGNTTWAYAGYLVVTGTLPVTWTFAESIDDNTYLKIDDAVVINDGTWNVPAIGTLTLSPGLHRFDARFWNGGGGAGAVAQSWWTDASIGFGVDRLGRAQQVRTNYEAIVDPGNGSVFCTQVTVTNAIVLYANAALRVGNIMSPTNNIAGVIADGGAGFGVTKIGEGTLSLDANNVYDGPTIVSNGTLLVNGVHAGVGAYTVSSNAVLGGTGTVSTATVTVRGGGRIGQPANSPGGTLTVAGLSLEDGARISCVLRGTNPVISVTTAMSTAGTVPVEIFATAAPIATGVHAVVRYTGSIGGAGDAAFTLVQPLPNGAQGYLTNNTANSTIELVVTDAGSGLRWMGDVNTSWDIAGTLNWRALTGVVSTLFYDGNAVRFDDTATGSTTVLLVQTVSPSAVVFNHSAFAYLLTGFKGIAGAGGLTKQGSGLLSIATAANAYSGQTTVAAGTIRVAATRPFGNTTGVVVQAGGQVNLGGIGQTNIGYSWTLAGAGPDGSGAVYNAGAALYEYSSLSNVTLAADTTIGAYGPGTTDAGRFDLARNGTLNGGGFQMTKVGAAPLNIRGTTTGLTNVLVQAGILVSENVNDNLGQNLVVQPGAKIAAYGGVSNSANVQLAGGTLSSWGGAQSIWGGTITLTADSFLHNNPGYAGYGNSDILVNGRITGPYGFTKAGTATVTIAGANDFGGTVTVTQGTLLVTGANTYSNDTYVLGGVLRLAGGADRLPTGRSLVLRGSDPGTALVDLNGFNQTIAALSGTNFTGAALTLGTGTLTIAGSGVGDFFGVISGAGSLVRSGSGSQILSASNLYTGGTTLQSGELRIRHDSSLGSGPLVMNGGTLSLDASGLWEGRVTGSFNVATANPKWSVNLTTEKGSSPSDALYLDQNTYVYTGYLNVTGSSPVTWTFVKMFDDSGLLKIDGATRINHTVWNASNYVTFTLSPGLHTFEARFGEGAGTCGPTNGWTLGFGYDPLGRNLGAQSNFVAMADAGDGNLFRRDDLVVRNAITLGLPTTISAPVTNTRVTIAGNIGGGAGFTKTGPGILALNGGNTYAGPTTVAAGSLLVNGTNSGPGVIDIQPGAGLWGSGVVAGATASIQSGARIGAGDGLPTNGTLAIFGVNLGVGATIGAVLNGTNPTLRVTSPSGFTTATSNEIRVVLAGPIATGTYPVIAYNVSIGGSGFGALTLGPLPNGASGYLNNNAAAGLVEIVITNAGSGLNWIGQSTNGIWDVATTPNWRARSSGSPAMFQSFDAVVFDDTASNFTVDVAAGVIPSSVVVSNGAQDYVFRQMSIAGAGGLTKYGAAALTLSNANSFKGATVVQGGRLSIASEASLGDIPPATVAGQLRLFENTTLEILGSTIVNTPRGLQIGPAAGRGTATVSVVAGATGTVNSIIANGPGGTGALIKTGSGTLVVSNLNTFSGGTIVSAGRLELAYRNGAVGAFAGGQPIEVQTGAVIQFNMGDVLGYAPTAPSVLNLNGGTATTLPSNGSYRTTLPSLALTAGTLTAAPDNAGDAGGVYLLNGSVTVGTASAASVISPPGGMSLQQTNTLFTVARGTAAYDLLVSGRLMNWTSNGNHGIIKTGDGIMVLSATNTYGGATLISGGTLVVGDGISGNIGTNTVTTDAVLAYNLPGTVVVAQAIAGTGLVVHAGSGTLVMAATNLFTGGAIVSSGVLRVSGSLASGVAVRPGAAVSGVGMILGSLTNDGFIRPGDAVGTLAVGANLAQSSAGTLAVELAATSSFDQLIVGLTADLGGTLSVSLVGGFDPAIGNSFTILSATVLNGTFAVTNLPATGPGEAWQVSYAGNAVTLTVVAAPSGGYDLYVGAVTNGLTGYADDADGDGYPNLLEYATGGSPTNADQAARLTGMRTNNLTALRFLRNTNAIDATILVEGSFSAANGAGWTALATNIAGSWGGATNVVESGTSSPVTVTVQDPASGATNRFLRLHVTRP